LQLFLTIMFVTLIRDRHHMQYILPYMIPSKFLGFEAVVPGLLLIPTNTSRFSET